MLSKILVINNYNYFPKPAYFFFFFLSYFLASNQQTVNTQSYQGDATDLLSLKLMFPQGSVHVCSDISFFSNPTTNKEESLPTNGTLYQ